MLAFSKNSGAADKNDNVEVTLKETMLKKPSLYESNQVTADNIQLDDVTQADLAQSDFSQISEQNPAQVLIEYLYWSDSPSQWNMFPFQFGDYVLIRQLESHKDRVSFLARKRKNTGLISEGPEAETAGEIDPESEFKLSIYTDVVSDLDNTLGVPILSFTRLQKTHLNEGDEFNFRKLRVVAHRCYLDLRLMFAEDAIMFNHPNIAKTHDCGMQFGFFFIVENNHDYPKLLEVSDQLTINERLEVLLQFSDAIQLLEQTMGPVSLLMPESCFLTPNNTAILSFDVDMYLRRSLLPDRISSSLDYSSPEEVSGKRDYDERPANVYSFGSLFYRVLTGQVPFSSPNTLRKMRAVIRDQPFRPSRVSPELTDSIDNICSKAMAKSPSKRYQSLADFSADIQAVLNGQEIEPYFVSSMPGWFPEAPSDRTKAILVLLATLALIVIVFVGRARFLTQF